MKINAEVDIFDDPEFCDSRTGLYQCGYIEDFNYCGLYCVKIDGMRRKKCPECKAAYQKAKQTKEVTPA